MAIHPRYAEAILDGCKHVEFRKRPLAPDVHTVVIYATAPVMRIVGEFAVDRILVTSPRDLWSSFGAIGGITEPAFGAYYASSETAAGILVRAPRRYRSPVPLAALDPQPAVPQSFTYLPEAALQRLHELGAGPADPLLIRLVSALAALVRVVRPHRAIAAVVPLRVLPTPVVPHDRDRVSARR